MNQFPVFQTTTRELQNCAREPIHLTTLVQPHGLLLACDAESGILEFVSANVEQHLGCPADQMLGRALADYVEEDAQTVQSILCSVTDGTPASVGLHLRHAAQLIQNYEVIAHRSASWVVIEAMPYSEELGKVDDRQLMESVVTSIGSLHLHKALPDFLFQCTAEIRQLAGYQRVILYRFLPDWSGEVLAESVADGHEQRFVGLRFPASDIPEQARALYRSNLLRVIGDVDAEPVPVHALRPDQVLDQSHSLLRSPSPMHLGYLRNMGVRATMTISLIKDGELWGMITCHHDKPRSPPVQLRRITTLLSALVAETAIVRIDAMELRDASTRAQALRNALNRLSAVLHGTGDLSRVLDVAMQGLTRELDVQDYGVVLEGQLLHKQRIRNSLFEFLRQKAEMLPAGEVYCSSSLCADAEQAPGWAGRWAGAAVVPVPGHANSFLWLLREEMTRQVRWAGTPSQRAETLPGGLRVLGPRESFAEWVQTVQGQSRSWSDQEESACLEMAREIADVCSRSRSQQMQSELYMLGFCMARLNDMVVVTDTATMDEPGPRIVYVNDAFVALTGYSRQEVLGRSPRFLQGPDTQREALDAIRAAMQAWKPVTVELVNYKKDGTPYWAEIAMAPIADSTGWYTHWVAIERNIGERKRAELDIQKLVFYDSLTGLPNRRMLTDRLRQALSTANRYGRNGALLFVDLDNFKDLNDTAGHHVGDELLCQVAVRLSAEVRAEDTVARLGGDEFVVMLEGLAQDQEGAATAAQAVAEKLITSISRSYELIGQSYTTTASIGLTLFMGQGGAQSMEELLKQADFAMYQAKSAGRNAWCFYDPATQAALVARNALELRLKEAVRRQRLSVHYQPIVDRHRKLSGVEALLRWHDEELGWVSPIDIIPIAEANGLIVPIGLWVLQQACELLCHWATLPDWCERTVSVNVSALQMRQPDFVDSVLKVVRSTGCKPALLKLELTESLLQQDVDVTIAKMERLRAEGIEFSIDDFGTGYSSLTYLRRLPLSVLKIDRSFVMDIEHDDGDRAICQTVLALGKTMSLQVVAEGVETSQQFEYLLQAGCDQFQGYLFSRPLPLEQLQQLE